MVHAKEQCSGKGDANINGQVCNGRKHSSEEDGRCKKDNVLGSFLRRTSKVCQTPCR